MGKRLKGRAVVYHNSTSAVLSMIVTSFKWRKRSKFEYRWKRNFPSYLLFEFVEYVRGFTIRYCVCLFDDIFTDWIDISALYRI